MIIFRLKELLKDRNITGKEFADTVGVTEASISNLVKGESIPRKDLLIKIARELNVDVRELFTPTKEAASETQLYTKNANGEFVKYAKIVKDFF